MRERASDTALLIAGSMLHLRADPATRALIAPETAAVARAALSIASPARAWAQRALRAPLMRGITRAVEAAVLPGIQLHYAARKRFIEDAAREAVARGATQVVVVAAGFDALGIRMSRASEKPVCFEVDHPATQAVKREAVAQAGIESSDVRLVPADLSRQSLIDAIGRVGYDPARRSCFVAEGLSMYLQEEDIVSLLATCGRHAPSGSRFIWTFMEPDADGRIAFHGSRRGVVDAWLQSRGEPFTWGIERERLPALLAQAGLELVEIADARLFRERYLAPAGLHRPLAAGESVCVAIRP